MNTAMTIRRLRMVLETLTHAKKEEFTMSSWGDRKHYFHPAAGKKAHCGTGACLAGHMSLDPAFRRLGMKGEWTKDGQLELPKINPKTGKRYTRTDSNTWNWLVKVSEVLGITETEADFLCNPDDIKPHHSFNVTPGISFPATRRGARARIYALIRRYREELKDAA